ncbi:MAG: transcription-repair coupling factor [bacterium]
MANSTVKCERLEKEFNQKGITTVFLKDDIFIKDNYSYSKNVLYIIRGSLNSGFEYPDQKFVVIADKELFGEEKNTITNKKAKGNSKNKTVINSFNDLKVGDYVVHDNHGIALFKGIEKVVTEGVSKDYLKLGYEDEAILYVSINQLDIVQKYSIIGNSTPKLNNLGSKHWGVAKAKARKTVQIVAKDLINLYAKRRSAQGFEYSKDNIWQTEFEENFPFIETDDQLQAILDMKKDMESPQVMDRLICGDVGFGKTEVAIRGAFKAVQDSKQVVFLVPTTILAQQHFETFTKRMENYPINVNVLSRFRTPKQQKQTIEGIDKGLVDIVIGTHRVLSKDINFKDLGLVIIDEEQRFGVKHKEKLKALKENVDILTLSATPIPRTLHMSMAGIRDMSLLEDPPLERMPVQTYVLEYDLDSIKNAINRELKRGGQVYYLHNRVHNIELEVSILKNILPEANISFAHGQMSERELEKVMHAFLQNEIDVLVCTTIIETGLDISNVNTIIINDSDQMGLSQLYQLRGRVGRSNKTSFAYLMYKKNKVLQEISEKRLQTIKEFTEFGSGFKIAMRDLEIRGAGNLLGAEQHGHVDIIGYDMYCKLLDQAILELSGKKIKEDLETVIDLNVNAFISPSYISNESQKLEMYKKISLIKTNEDLLDVSDELIDKFGEMPRSVSNLLSIALLKSYATIIGITKISQNNNKVLIKFSEKNIENLNISALKALLESNLNFKFDGSTHILYYSIKNKKENFIKILKDIFLSLYN